MPCLFLIDISGYKLCLKAYQSVHHCGATVDASSVKDDIIDVLTTAVPLTILHVFPQG